MKTALIRNVAASIPSAQAGPIVVTITPATTGPRTTNVLVVSASKAFASWSRAADLDPRQYDALFNLGVVAAQRGQTDVARKALARFVATAPPAVYARDLQEARRMLKGMGGA